MITDRDMTNYVTLGGKYFGLADFEQFNERIKSIIKDAEESGCRKCINKEWVDLHPLFGNAIELGILTGDREVDRLLMVEIEASFIQSNLLGK